MALQKLYRKDYTGEFLIYNVELEDGNYEEEREWFPNTIENNNHYGTAVIIGNGNSRKSVSLELIKNHRTGIGGVNRIQSYGCNALHRNFHPDFLVLNNQTIIDEVKNKNIASNIMLSNVKLLTNPGIGNLIPYSVNMNAGAIATYLACFDGHKKVYLMGFDNQANQENNNMFAGTPGYDAKTSVVSSYKWELCMSEIFRTYTDVEFIHVNPVIASVPKNWRSCLNYRTVDSRQFALAVDL
jgi:hypothetical protein